MSARKDLDEFEAAMRDLGVQPQQADERGHAPPAEATELPPASARSPEPAEAEAPASSGDAGGADSVGARMRELERALAELRHERDELRAERDRLEAERTREAARAAEHAEKLETMRGERDQYDRERRKLNQHVAELREALPAEPHGEPSRSTEATLGGLLRERGCEGGEEMALALTGLLDQRAEELADRVELSDPGPLRGLLDERLAFLCGDPSCQASPATTVIRVPRERCEVCGGSDIRRAFRGFVDACQAAEVQRITIVGGSPAYREQLETLRRNHGSGLRLKLVAGSRPPGRKRARDLVRGSDLVLIWGATILDHSTSDAFDPSDDRVVFIRHRGIAGMLEQAVEALAR